jgi:hypothetical protein
VKVLLAFLLIVTVGTMWETTHDRRPRAWPLLALCLLVAAMFFKVARVL